MHHRLLYVILLNIFGHGKHQLDIIMLLNFASNSHFIIYCIIVSIYF